MQYNPKSCTHPGLTLNDKLNEINMTIKNFANLTGISEKIISCIIDGSNDITPDMSIQFEKVLKIPAHFWDKYQKTYNNYSSNQEIDLI